MDQSSHDVARFADHTAGDFSVGAARSLRLGARANCIPQRSRPFSTRRRGPILLVSSREALGALHVGGPSHRRVTGRMFNRPVQRLAEPGSIRYLLCGYHRKEVLMRTSRSKAC